MLNLCLTVYLESDLMSFLSFVGSLYFCRIQSSYKKYYLLLVSTIHVIPLHLNLWRCVDAPLPWKITSGYIRFNCFWREGHSPPCGIRYWQKYKVVRAPSGDISWIHACAYAITFSCRDLVVRLDWKLNMLSSGIAVYASGFKRRLLLLWMLFYYICLMLVFVMLSRLFFANKSWERAASWLSCVFCFLGFCHVPI